MTEKKRSNAGSASSVSTAARRWNSTLFASLRVEVRAREREVACGDVGGDDSRAAPRKPRGDAPDAAAKLQAGRVVARTDARACERRIEARDAILAAGVERFDRVVDARGLEFLVGDHREMRLGIAEARPGSGDVIEQARDLGRIIDVLDLHRRLVSVERRPRAGDDALAIFGRAHEATTDVGGGRELGRHALDGRVALGLAIRNSRYAQTIASVPAAGVPASRQPSRRLIMRGLRASKLWAEPRRAPRGGRSHSQEKTICDMSVVVIEMPKVWWCETREVIHAAGVTRPSAHLLASRKTRSHRSRRRARSMRAPPSCGIVRGGDFDPMPGFLRLVVALDAHAKIKPCGLTGHRIGVRALRAVGIGWKQLVDQVIEQEAVVELRRTGREFPCAFAFADRVPGPHGAGRGRRMRARRHADASAWRDDPDPVAVARCRRRARCRDGRKARCVLRSGGASGSASPRSGT